ncbi:unnamed protein product [Dibothriocephalus latus]|uniref:Uncharacterized protein n=1 Tax=Dibothriocephalus latus TaxID=60516 RepID=A0A3P7M036_DIBLA|nr:unnamed protein product [Dibothriocephalus latus]
MLVNFFTTNANRMVGLALSPNQSSISFFIASYTVFSVSLLFGACLGLGYFVLSASFGQPVWEFEQEVLKPFAVPAFIAGRRGTLLLYCVGITTSVASCACNVHGLISLALHDFVQTYLKPFKRTKSITDCLLCDKPQGNFSGRRSECRCCSILDCADCRLDTMQRQRSMKHTLVPFTCRIHGAYRTYLADIDRFWSKLMVLASFCLTPSAILLQNNYVSSSGHHLCSNHVT